MGEHVPTELRLSEDLPHQPLFQLSGWTCRTFPTQVDVDAAPGHLLRIDMDEQIVEQIVCLTPSDSEDWECIGDHDMSSSGRLCAGVRANAGIHADDMPSEGLWPLFEITVLGDGGMSNGLSVGFVGENIDTKEVILPLGEAVGSVGLCQNGECCNSLLAAGDKKTMTSFKIGDSVGLLYDGSCKVATFTINGTPVSGGSVTLPSGCWFPAISLSAVGARARFNFGKEQFSEGLTLVRGDGQRGCAE